ncbi:uncharacterized protein LOC142611012 [Castanea sativa]|uniref:uncharacterized protein LOC142611012 n=1 Tax=Castanea sativa TaxID=21020 RepID=UPI003F6500DC
MMRVGMLRKIWMITLVRMKKDKEYHYNHVILGKKVTVIMIMRSMMSYSASPDNQLENCLWTYKYKPKKATEVCGNDESVKFLSDWLHMWHERGFQISKVRTDGDQCDMQDDDYRCSDSEDIDEEPGLKNVLLVTGLVGCGKFAAIYACAQEQGFEILELSASDCRSGALVKQRFGEALESRWLKRPTSGEVATDIQVDGAA